jgi:hypothetical protein
VILVVNEEDPEFIHVVRGTMDLAVAVTHDAADGLFYVDGFVDVLHGSGTGTFSAPGKYATDNSAFSLVHADFTRDGVPDIATSNLASP